MMNCREITSLATDHAEGHLGAAERALFESHIAGCQGCATWVKQLGITSKVLGALPEPEMPVELRRQLLEAFDGWARTGAVAPARATAPSGRRLAAGAAITTLAIFGLLVALARRPSHAPAEWAAALVLLGVASALGAYGRLSALGLAAVAVPAALAAALLIGGPGPLELAGGGECLLTVVASGGAAAGAAWLLLRRRAAAQVGAAAGAWAVGGALAGAAALQVACSGRESLAHLLVFHVGGLLLVAAAALLLPRLRARAA